MSKSPLRKDKTCLNCMYVVENRFCPNCGQENTDTRKTFYHLFVHFFEDLTHYENSFWKTIHNLILKPGSLTKEYLSGKRMSYLAPIRLYIFISFVTFFLFSIIPKTFKEETLEINNNSKEVISNDSLDKKNDSISKKIIEKLNQKGLINDIEKNSIKNKIQESKSNKEKDSSEGLINLGYKNLKELDSVQKFGKPEDKENSFVYWLIKNSLEAQKGKTKQEVQERLLETMMHNIPKALFIYMPLFAFILWLFHSKKRWYYFDHGIFTLHYFSFLLLASLIMELFTFLLEMIGDYTIINFIIGVLDFIIVCYIFYYFFPAHHRFYEQSKMITIVKGCVIFFINIFILIIILLGLFLYSFINIH